MVRTMCNNEAKNIGKLFNRVSAEFVKISKVHHDIKKELELCDYRINNCEGDIGYKMLIKQYYSFLRKNRIQKNLIIFFLFSILIFQFFFQDLKLSEFFTQGLYNYLTMIFIIILYLNNKE